MINSTLMFIAPNVDPTQVASVVFPYKFHGINICSLIVYLNIILTCIGACMAYVIFICETLPAVVTGMTDVCKFVCFIYACMCACSYVTVLQIIPIHAIFINCFVQWEVIALVGPVLLALALLRSFRVLSFTSILGDVAIVTGLLFLLNLMDG